MRIYVPATLALLTQLSAEGEIFPLGGTVFGVTPALREAFTAGDDEELAEVAIRAAARASLRLLSAHEDPELERVDASGLPVRRAVIAVDVDRATPRPDLDDAVLKITEPIALRAVASVLVDGPDAEAKVRAAVAVIDAADLGDEDAELTVGDAEDLDLGWYATQELPFLLDLL